MKSTKAETRAVRLKSGRISIHNSDSKYFRVSIIHLRSVSGSPTKKGNGAAPDRVPLQHRTSTTC